MFFLSELKSKYRPTLPARILRWEKTFLRRWLRAFTHSLRKFIRRLREAASGVSTPNNPHLAALPPELRIHSMPNLAQLRLHRVIDSQSLRDRGMEIFKKRGVFPISFSNPRQVSILEGPRVRFLSEVIPGEPYGFHNEDLYLQQYRESYFGLSTKKAGWDCFRHLEISFAGSIPLVPGIESTPPGVMFAYPKLTWTEVFSELSAYGPRVPSEALIQDLAIYSEEYLSSSAMATYMLEVLDYQGGPVAFVDDQIDTWVDYQSVFSLIGLSRVLGDSLAMPGIPGYLVDPLSVNQDLYGRGFGYVGALDGLTSSSFVTVTSSIVGDLLDSFELIVFGHFFRDFPSTGLGGQRGWDKTKLVGILGDDYPVTQGTIRRLAASGGKFFVRELY